MPSCIVDTAVLTRDFIGVIEREKQKPLIFVELEGVDLSRHVYLVDICSLKEDAFDVPGPDDQTLRIILESKDYPKVFFDVRNDSDALYSHFKIGLQGVIDLQLLEVASRPGRARFVKGLAKCISEDGRLNWTQSQEWQRIKEAGQRLFVPEKGGSYEVFLERPLPSILQEYCAQDVLVMPDLLSTYGRRLRPHLAGQINAEVLKRVLQSQSPSYEPKGRDRTIAPSFSESRYATLRCNSPTCTNLTTQKYPRCVKVDIPHEHCLLERASSSMHLEFCGGCSHTVFWSTHEAPGTAGHRDLSQNTEGSHGYYGDP